MDSSWKWMVVATKRMRHHQVWVVQLMIRMEPSSCCFMGWLVYATRIEQRKFYSRRGYKLIHSSLYGLVVIEGDSKILNTWESGLGKAPWPLFYILKQIKTLLRDINATSRHVPREPNEIANNWRSGSQKEGFIIVNWLITWLPFVIFCGLLTPPFTPFGLLIFV